MTSGVNRMFVMILYNIDSYTQRYDIGNTSKNTMIQLHFDLIQEYIDRYFNIMILYTYFKQPSTFLFTHKCNQNI